jgi:hypothetical protein
VQTLRVISEPEKKKYVSMDLSNHGLAETTAMIAASRNL